MAIRRIKAHTAVEEGQYIKISRKSKRILGLIMGTFLGFFISVFIVFSADSNLVPQEQFFVVVSISIALGVLGASSASGAEERMVPKADLVEIKRYIWPERVTVVLDDERSRMGKLRKQDEHMSS